MATKAAPKKNSTAIATTKPNLPAKKSSEDINALLLADQGAGQETMGAKDLMIPRISILQSLSPQLQKAEGAFLKGAEAGDFLDNVAAAVAWKGEKGFLLIPVSYRRSNVEWIPKKKGGGFVADHGPDDSILAKTTKNEDGAMMLANGHEVVTTAEYYCYVLNLDGTDPRQAVISMAKTQLKKSRKLNSMVTSLLVDNPSGKGKFNPAMFYSVFAATSVPESNQKGNWMGWNITRHGNTLDLPNGEELYLKARQFRESVSAGKVKVADPTDSTASHGDGGSPEDSETL
jgi:hypothetical protein